MRFLLLVSILLYFFFSQGQERFQGYLNLGTSASQISGDDSHGFAQFGIYTGASIEYKLNDPWFLATGLFFNQKGARRYQSIGAVSTYRLRVNYIDVPFLTGYQFQDFKFTFGPAMNVKINQRERTEYGETENPRIFDPLEIAIQGGASYQFMNKWTLNLSYQNSILPVREHSPTYYSSSVNNTLLEEWHQNLINKGQYFSLFSLFVSYRL